MYIDRVQIKQDARAIIGEDKLWLQMFAAMLLVTLPITAANTLSNGFGSIINIMQNGPTTDASAPIIALFSGFAVFLSFCYMTVAILTIPFNVALGGYYREAVCSNQKTDVLFPYKYGKQHYAKLLGTGFLMGLFIFLFSLLFIIPGIIMTYAYLFVPYIICENPELTPSQALDISKRMTKGLKMDLFIMHLSFFLWFLGIMFTFGILALYVTPYMQAVQVLYYEKFKDHAIKNGIVSASELGIVPQVPGDGFDYSQYDYQPAYRTPVASNPDFEPYQPNFAAAPVDQGYPVNDSIYDIYERNAQSQSEQTEESTDGKTETEE